MEKFPAREIYRHAIRRAIKNNIATATLSEFENWFALQELVCVYCGMTNDEAKSAFAHRLHIDRKNSDDGYVIGNLCLACHRCNLVKNKYLTHEQMKEVASMFFTKTSSIAKAGGEA